MKKITSLLMAVLMLCTMLSVFAVPAFAEETKTAEEYYNDAQNYHMNRQYRDAANAYIKVGECYEKANSFDLAGSFFCSAAEESARVDDYASVAYAYMKAGECYLKNGNFSDAGDCFSNAANAAWRKAKVPTGSTLSEGNITIIVGIAALVIGLGGGFILGTKKKKKTV